MESLGTPFYQPFGFIGKDDCVYPAHPSFFLVVSHFLQPASVVDETYPWEKQMEIIAGAKQGIEMFLRSEPILREMLPVSLDKGRGLSVAVDQFFSQWASPLKPPGGYMQLSALRKSVDGFFTTLRDEMDRLPTFTVVSKGNLNIQSLVGGMSKGYPKGLLEMLDEFVIREIDHAGKCLAFELPTSCGFHILRAVETCLKGFCYAKTGKLPPVKNRNWVQYIDYLQNAGVHSDVIDILRMLKTKRNPLMHPTDTLTIDEAISLICLCQSGMEIIVADVHHQSLELNFKDALKLMPTL